MAVRDSATGALTYLLGDQLGSTSVSVNAAGGTPLVQRYLPYGAPRSTAGGAAVTDRGWIGQTKDNSTGLQYLNARYYDPVVGRFTAVDPLADLGNPNTLDPYGYSADNPISGADPSGLFFLTFGGGPTQLTGDQRQIGLQNAQRLAGFTPPDIRTVLARKARQVAGGFGDGAKGTASLAWGAFSCVGWDNCDTTSDAAVASADMATNPTQVVKDCLGGFEHCLGEAIFAWGLKSTVGRVGAHSPQAVDDLTSAANRAAASVGSGRGPVYGTRVHSAFADELAALGRADVFSEISYLDGRVVPYGTRGSVRLDAVVGSPSAPSAIYDLKTGSASLTPARIAQIRSHLPPGFQDVPVAELRPA